MRWLWHVGAAAARLSRRPIGERRALADGRRALLLRIAIADRSVVRADNGQGCYGRRKNYLVASSAKFNIASEKAPHFRGRFVTPVSDPKMARCQTGICQLPADPHQRHQPELD